MSHFTAVLDANVLHSERSKGEREAMVRRITLAHVDRGPLLRWQGLRESTLILQWLSSARSAPRRWRRNVGNPTGT